MDIKVQLNNIRIAPRKSREVVDLIRGKKAEEAKTLLEFTVKRAADPILKLLNSAVSSAEHNFQLKNSDLYISKVFVDEGPKLKRMHPMSRGRGYPIMKRTSHVTLILSQLNSDKEEKKKKKLRGEKIKKSKIEKIKTPRKINKNNITKNLKS